MTDSNAPPSDNKAPSQEVFSAPSMKRQKTSTIEADIIDLTGPDLPVFKVNVNMNDDEVEIVDPPPPKMPIKTERTSAGGDVEIVGTVNEVKLPHMRPHCTEHPFQSGDDSNIQACDLCFCFVCDVPYNECKEWRSHCDATDKGPRAYHWKSLRRSQQNTTVIFEATMRDGKMLRRIFQTVSKFAKKITLECESHTGIHCRAMDAKRTAGVSLKLERSAFSNYLCRENVRLCVNVVDVTRALKNVKGPRGSAVILKATSSVLTITVQNGGWALDPVHIPLLYHQDYEPFNEPSQGYKSLECTMQTTSFKQVVDSYHKQDRNVRMVLPASDDQRSLLFRVPISSVADEQRTRVMGNVGIVKENHRSSVTEAHFMTQPLFHFTRGRSPLSRYMDLLFSPNNQMKIKYELGYGYFALHISSLVDD